MKYSSLKVLSIQTNFQRRITMKAILIDVWEDLLLFMSFIFRWIGNAVRHYAPIVLAEARAILAQFTAWFNKTLIPFLWEERKWVLLVVAVLGTLLSIAFDAEWRTVLTWILLTIAAVINALNKWGVVLTFLSEKATILISGIVDVMIGKSKGGLILAMFVDGAILFPLGFWVGGENGYNIIVLSILLVIGGILLAWNKKANS